MTVMTRLLECTTNAGRYRCGDIGRDICRDTLLAHHRERPLARDQGQGVRLRVADLAHFGQQCLNNALNDDSPLHAFKDDLVLAALNLRQSRHRLAFGNWGAVYKRGFSKT